MNKKTLGTMISSLRKEKGMTQLELANMLNVTDKAVSKWERDISCPDINSLPRLAEILEVSVDDLMQSKNNLDRKNNSSVKDIIRTVMRVMPIAMGVAVVVTSILDVIDVKDAVMLLGIGLACAGIALISGDKNED